MAPLIPHGITLRRERFDVATASQLGSPSTPSPTFSDIQWQSTFNNTTRPALKDRDLQLTIKPEVKPCPAEDLSSDCSPYSSSPIDLQKGTDRKPTTSYRCQDPNQRKPGFGTTTSSANQPAIKSHRRSRLTAAQVKQCSLIFARSALLREQYDGRGISYSDIPLSVIFPLVQGLKLPFDLLFRSLAICDAKIAGLPIKAHSEKFVLSSCGLEVGSCKFLNLPINRVDTCSAKCLNGDRNDRVCGRTLVSTELGVPPFKRNETRGKIRSGKDWKSLWRCGDNLSFTIDFAREMVEPPRSRIIKVTGTERTAGKQKQGPLLASRISFSNIIRRIVESEDGNISPWGPNGNCCRSRWSDASRRRSRQLKNYTGMRKAFPHKFPTGLPRALIIPFDPPVTSPRSPRLYREFDFLCFIRLVTEMQKYFLIVKPMVRCSSPQTASISHHILSSNYKLAWVSPALTSGKFNLNKTNANANATANNNNNKSKNNETLPKVNHDANLLSLFVHTPITELEDLVAHLAKQESFMTKTRWGPDAQRIWVCGVLVSDGKFDDSSAGSPAGTGKANGADAEESTKAAVEVDDGGGGDEHEQRQNPQRRNKWWVLFLLNRKLARYIQ